MSLIPADGRPVLSNVVSDMLSALEAEAGLSSVSGLPASRAEVVELTERPVGLGDLRGNETRGPVASVALKGGRLDALVRFELWAAAADAVNLAVDKVRENLLKSLDALRAQGFLTFAAAETTSAERVSIGLTSTVWRKTAAFRVLYEYHYQDVSRAAGLITRIPVTSDPDGGDPANRETHVVTGPAVRWDEEAAPLWRLRGPARFTRLAALARLSAQPGGQVTVSRTFDGAAGPPASAASLNDLLDAVDPEDPPFERHAQLVFTDLTAFLASFAPTGAEVVLGIDPYAIHELVLAPALVLPGPEDRLEISYQHPKFDPTAALYLKL